VLLHCSCVMLSLEQQKCVYDSPSLSTAEHCCTCLPWWAARYNTWLLIKLTPKGVVFSFLFFSFLFFSFLFPDACVYPESGLCRTETSVLVVCAGECCQGCAAVASESDSGPSRHWQDSHQRHSGLPARKARPRPGKPPTPNFSAVLPLFTSHNKLL